jgi:oligopeptide transport system substrate-binding protein
MRGAWLGLASALLLACSGSQNPGSSDAVLRRGSGPEVDTLDPQLARTDSAVDIVRDLFEGLTAIGADGQAVAAAASTIDVSDDGLHYRFHLRPNLRWSNGEALTAPDFLAGWRRLVDPVTAAPYAQVLAPVHGAAAIIAGKSPPESLGAAAPNALTFEVNLDKPTPYFLGLVTHPATFPAYRGAALQTAQNRERAKISNGAFRLDKWAPGQTILAVRNSYFWNNAANKIDRVEYHQIAEPAAEYRRYRAGDIDLTYTIPHQEFTAIRERHGAELHISPQLTVYYYGFNLRRPPFAGNAKLRRALAMVIDRERITRSITGVGELPAYSFVPDGTSHYTPPRPDYAAWSMAERIARAKALLREAGFDPTRSPIEIRFNTSEIHGKIAVAIAAMWQESLGVRATLVPEEFKALLQDIDRGVDTQVFRSSWVGDYNDAYTFLQLLETGFGINLPRYSNPRYDALLKAASLQLDLEARGALLAQAEAMMLADQPLVPLYFYVNKHLVKPRVHGWHDNIMNVCYSKDLWLDPRSAAR